MYKCSARVVLKRPLNKTKGVALACQRYIWTRMLKLAPCTDASTVISPSFFGFMGYYYFVYLWGYAARGASSTVTLLSSLALKAILLMVSVSISCLIWLHSSSSFACFRWIITPYSRYELCSSVLQISVLHFFCITLFAQESCSCRALLSIRQTLQWSFHQRLIFHHTHNLLVTVSWDL